MEFKNYDLECQGIFHDGDNYCSDDDDDAFYIEIRRQILLLTADDEGEDSYQAKLTDSKRGFSRLASLPSCAFQHGSNFHWWEGENTGSAPSWLVNLWKSTGNGTGVFIPQIVKSSRRNRHAGRTSNEKGRVYRAKKQL